MGDSMETEVQGKERVLTRSDRCDAPKCPAQAWVIAKFVTGELYFCGHHFDKYEVSIIRDAYDIVDEREFINAKSESSA
jgi:hypothetical protein